MRKRNVHVVPRKDGWAVKSEGAKKATKIHKTQKDAIIHAMEIAKNRGVENVIHGRDGRIRDKDSYGSDPYPPRDKKH